MKCISKFINKYECFYLTKESVNEFISWINNVTCMHYEIKNKTHDCINVCDNSYGFYEFKFYFGEWAVYKDNSIFTYTDKEFNRLYETKEK